MDRHFADPRSIEEQAPPSRFVFDRREYHMRTPGHHENPKKYVLRIYQQTPLFFAAKCLVSILLWVTLIVGWSMGWFEMKYMTHWCITIFATYMLSRVIGGKYFWFDYYMVLYFLPLVLATVMVVLVVVHYIFFVTKIDVCAYRDKVGVFLVSHFVEHMLVASLTIIFITAEIDRIRKMFFVLYYKASPASIMPTIAWQFFSFLIPFGVYSLCFSFNEVYFITVTFTEMFGIILIVGLLTVAIFLIVIFYGYLVEPKVAYETNIVSTRHPATTKE